MQNNIVNETKEALAHSKKSILKATCIALLAALVILFTAILPAEYGVDPTGIGKVLGFSNLADSKTDTSESVVRYQARPAKYKQNTVELRLAPHQGFEYKFILEQGSMMMFSWMASKEIEYDFHGEPKDGPKGYFESYEKKNVAKEEHGSFVASFPGTHGWYFKNNTGNTITISLSTSGYYEVFGVKGATPEQVIVRQQ
jgi:hypothetical protein